MSYNIRVQTFSFVSLQDVCSMGEELKLLKSTGTDDPANDDEEIQLEHLIQSVDLVRFNRGREFFKKNIVQCVLAMLFSLVIGLSIKELLDVLVTTEKSSTPKTALKRYLRTLSHVLKWHYGNVWEKSSTAYESIKSVRAMHSSARKLMAQKNNKEKLGSPKMHVSQYDMALVQSGFIGFIIVYPEHVGIKCTRQELEDYVYFWRYIGSLLGIKDSHNLCSEGYDKAYKLCKAVKRDVGLPALENPPEQFYSMASAVTVGINKLMYFEFFSPDIVMASVPMTPSNTCLSFKDKCKVYLIKLFFMVMYYVPWVSKFVNQRFEKACRFDKII